VISSRGRGHGRLCLGCEEGRVLRYWALRGGSWISLVAVVFALVGGCEVSLVCILVAASKIV
jgi:hypothetical protein